MTFEPSRAAALNRLADFLPQAGQSYANSRNYDDGRPAQGVRRNVSQLSPWLHAGLLDEAELISAVLGKHSPDDADKFIAEVFWRIYFKGYLEQRPTIWRAYTDGRGAALVAVEANSGLAKAYHEAIEGRTGIAAFDHWAHELVQTGYLHNHARMWFASIWIFTLKLDWHLGADFFLRHLIDGNAASNTLSWRWVGGLHTKGKTYLARPDNIARYTANHPDGPLSAEGLAEDAPALEEDRDHGLTPLSLPSPPKAEAFEQPYALILHDESASHVPLNLPQPPALIIGAARPEARSPASTGDLARSFAHGAVEAAMAQASEAFGREARLWHSGENLSDILGKAGTGHIALPFIPTGWTRDSLMPELAPFIEAGQATQLLGDLDRRTWPLAKAGFFGVKKEAGSVLRELGISG